MVLSGQLVSQRACIIYSKSEYTNGQLIADNPVSRGCQTRHERTDGRTDRQTDGRTNEAISANVSVKCEVAFIR